MVDNTELPIESAQVWQGAVRRTVAVCPDWEAAAIGAVVARKMSREIWQQLARDRGIQMLAVDAWSGSYRGEIIQMDDLYILQIVGEDVVMHDRLLLKSDCAIGQALSISYCAQLFSRTVNSQDRSVARSKID